MNITPIEIRQKEFERHFRGYDKDEVNAFLHTLSQAWERLLQENRDKSARLEKAEKDIEKVREVEGSLFRTLRTAEDTSAGIVNKAQKEAEQLQQEANEKKQEIIEEAHQQAERILSEARQQVEQLKQDAIDAETQRQQALAQLQELAQRILNQVESSDASHQNPEALSIESSEAETLIEENEAEEPAAPIATLDQVESDDYQPSATAEEAASQEDSEDAYEPVWATGEEDQPLKSSEPSRLKRKSFFDELD